MAANLNVFKNIYIYIYIYIYKNPFYANRTIFSKKLIGCYEESAEEKRKLTLWAL